MATLKMGETVPDFERPDQQGRLFRLSSLRGRPVVVFFYPKDHTPACTAQACAFRDSYEAFAQAGAAVVGISTGSAESHAGFAERFRLPFTLVADDGSIRALWGVPQTLGLFPGRVTYVLDGEGRLRHQFNSQLRVSEHIRSALEVIRAMGPGPAAGAGPGAGGSTALPAR